MKEKMGMKVLGALLAIAGVAITLVSEEVKERQRKEEMREEVDKAVSKKMEELES